MHLDTVHSAIASKFTKLMTKMGDIYGLGPECRRRYKGLKLEKH